MKVKLVCNDENKEYIINLLKQHHIEIGDDADYVLTENTTKNNFLIGLKNGVMEVVKDTEILYFESLGEEVFCITTQGTYQIRERLYVIESKYLHKHFLRVNKSYIVNVNFIKEIIPWIGSKYRLRMNNDIEIDVNRTYYAAFKNYLGL